MSDVRAFIGGDVFLLCDVVTNIKHEILATFFVESLPSPCRQLAVTLPSLCPHFAFTLPSLCLHVAFTLPPLCLHFAATLLSLCPRLPLLALACPRLCLLILVSVEGVFWRRVRVVRILCRLRRELMTVNDIFKLGRS